MPTKRGLERTLAGLREVRADPFAPTSLATLRTALADRSNVAVGRAAEIVGHSEIAALARDLVAAFDRFLEEPAADPGCAAKSPIMDALYRLGYEEPAVFLRGLRCVQMERAYDPPWVDTAIDVRGSAAFGLARSGYRHALVALADLLADKESPARAAAARAMAYRAEPAALPVLRFKIRIGDDESSVLTECFLAMLKIDSRGSLEFVTDHLRTGGSLALAAGIALGDSRLPEALAPLRDWSRTVSGTQDEGTALLALAALRHDEAFDELLSIVREGAERSACRALEALGVWRGDERLIQRTRAACRGRNETAVSATFERVFVARV
jgi:HEAT repeat protein